jgi:arylsulfatase
LPAAEWTLASVLKTGGYDTYFTGKWHLGEDDYALPNAQGYDVMKYVGLYHLNAYTYADPTWFPDMDDETRAMFTKVTKGACPVKLGKSRSRFKINGQYVDTPVIDGKPGVVGIPFFDNYVEKATMEFLDTAAKSNKPFFINVNFMKVHQPNMPAPEFSTSRYPRPNTPTPSSNSIPASGASWTSSKRWVWIKTPWWSTPPTTAPGRTFTPTPATPSGYQRHRARGGNRVPAIMAWPGKIKPDTKITTSSVVSI